MPRRWVTHNHDIECPSPRPEAGPAAAPGRLSGAQAIGDPAHISLLLGAALATVGSQRTGGCCLPCPSQMTPLEVASPSCQPGFISPP